MATHSSVLVWWIPWTEEPGRLQSIGSHRVRHNWSNLTHTHAWEIYLCVYTHKWVYYRDLAFTSLGAGWAISVRLLSLHLMLELEGEPHRKSGRRNDKPGRTIKDILQPHKGGPQPMSALINLDMITRLSHRSHGPSLQPKHTQPDSGVRGGGGESKERWMDCRPSCYFVWVQQINKWEP